MCVKTTFLNDNLDENIYRGQLEGFIKQRSKEKGLQVEMIHLWIETCIQILEYKVDNTIKFYGFDQNVDEPCIYKKIIKGTVVFLGLYVEDILLVENDVGFFTNIKYQLFVQF